MLWQDCYPAMLLCPQRASQPVLQGLAVKAIRGDAVLFYSLLPNGTVDPMSEHGSCSTLKGEKYSATKWVRATGKTVLRDMFAHWEWPYLGLHVQRGSMLSEGMMSATGLAMTLLLVRWASE